MFNQRQWAELNAFAASFGAGNNDDGSQQAQPAQPHPPDNQFHHQPDPSAHHHMLRGQGHGHGHHQHQHQDASNPHQNHFHQQPDSHNSQQHAYQFGFSPQQEWSRFAFDTPARIEGPQSTSQHQHQHQHQLQQQQSQQQQNHHNQHLHHQHHDQTAGFAAAVSTDSMDWTPTTDFGNDFANLGAAFRTEDPAIKMEPDYMNRGMVGNSDGDSGNRGVASGIGRLIAQFETKDMQPALPPRPQEQPVDSNTVASPIAINPQHQSQSHFGQFNTTSNPQSTSFAAGSFSSNPFAGNNNNINTPSDTHFGSFGTPHSRVTSPVARSPGPNMPFGSFRDASQHIGSPGPNTSDPFGSLDSFVTPGRMGPPQNMATSSPMVSSPPPQPPRPTQGTSGTPGFAIWRPPSHEQQQQPPQQQQQQQQTPQPQHSQNFQQYQPQLQHQRQSSQPAVSSPGGGYFHPPPPAPPKPATTPSQGGNQFILELNPGSKARGKAPAKPPKPRAPKPTLPAASPAAFTPPIKQEQPPTPQPSLMSPTSESIPDRKVMETTPQPPSGARPPREQVPPESWEQYKSIIHDLYLEQRKPLKEVMAIMAEKYNFQATPKMYKTRFSQWGFVKNNTEDEVKKLLSMKFQRDAEGKVSEFVRNGKIINLGTYLKRKGVTEYDLVDFELPANLPSHIRCRTPTPPPAPDYLKSPDLVRAQELVVGNMRKAFLQCRQWEIETDRKVGWPSIMVWGAPSSEMLTEANFYFEAGDVDSGGQCLMNAFNQLEIDLKQLSPQAILEVLLGMVRRDPGLMTALCKYVAAFSTTNYDRAHPLRQIFTCLYEVQQKHGAATLSELLWGSTPLVAEELEAIYGRRHPYVARTWIDLALFYDQKDTDRLDKLARDLRVLHRQMEQGKEDDFSALLALRYAIAQLHHTANPDGEGVKQAAKDLVKDMKKEKLLCRVRDSRPNVFCYHCAVKNDPWTKRCRRRYDSVVELLEKHAEVKILPYFEEDFHTMQHEPDAQTSWSAVMGQPIQQSRWGFI